MGYIKISQNLITKGFAAIRKALSIGTKGFEDTVLGGREYVKGFEKIIKIYGRKKFNIIFIYKIKGVKEFILFIKKQIKAKKLINYIRNLFIRAIIEQKINKIFDIVGKKEYFFINNNYISGIKKFNFEKNLLLRGKNQFNLFKNFLCKGIKIFNFNNSCLIDGRKEMDLNQKNTIRGKKDIKNILFAVGLLGEE